MAQVTIRAIISGLIIGSLVLFSNFQFGLQTGWVTMMSLPSALLGFAAFRTLQSKLQYSFSPEENVFVQSVAVAVGTGPLAFGLVGVVPAIEKFLNPVGEGGFKDMTDKIKLSISQLIVWSFGLAFFGVFFAVLLRRQIIEREQLRFPTGSATAVLISVLHKTRLKHEVDKVDENNESQQIEHELQEEQEDDEYYRKNIQILTKSFWISSFYTISAYFLPILRDLPILGNKLAKNYLITFQPSPAYIGQGIIMGLPTVSSMLLGAVLGWGILGPLAKHKGWAPGPIDDWKTGAQGWIMWVSLAVMVADAVVGFIAVSIKSLYNLHKKHDYQLVNDNEDDYVDGVDNNQNDENTISYKMAVFGLLISLVACLCTTNYVFGHVPIYSTFCAVILALFLSILAVRALGETDLNPVSGIGKISQVLFAFIIPKDHPGSVLINLIAGGITEAGAQQAGDLMQDLKTGHLIGADPKAQFIAQMIGSGWSVILSALVYRLYDSIYEIPSHLFRIPTAVIWIDCSRLVTGEGLPPYAQEFSLVFGSIFAVFAVLKVVYQDKWWVKYIPSGVACGVGLYNTISFTLARFIGGVISYWYHNHYSDSVWLIICSSGLVLGEGITSIVSLIFTALKVPHL